VIGYQQLLREVWGYDGSPSEAQELLKAHVRLLRRKLGLIHNGRVYPIGAAWLYAGRAG
jgi:DNA-binding response OmpR family regulator